MSKSYKELMNGVRAFVLDVDGVLTDASVHVTSSGELLRVMNIRDGYAMKAAAESGYLVCVISGGSNEGVRIRLQNLGISEIHLGASDKVETLRSVCERHGIPPQHILYMGDDLPDFHVMQNVGLAACPQDAVPEIKAISHYISHRSGGRGAVRDVIEQVMKVQHKWGNYFNAKYD
jgi:3-deoxy-D-manno-octulosonate 8-phosphate phosphatase (KDO 8-P phosphatase)